MFYLSDIGLSINFQEIIFQLKTKKYHSINYKTKVPFFQYLSVYQSVNQLMLGTY